MKTRVLINEITIKNGFDEGLTNALSTFLNNEMKYDVDIELIDKIPQPSKLLKVYSTMNN